MRTESDTREDVATDTTSRPAPRGNLLGASNTSLFNLWDLEDPSRTSKLADNDLNALRAVAEWINTFVARPHKDLGRAGPVCPFVPRALELHTLWLAAEKVTGRSTSDLVQIIASYEKLFLETLPVAGEYADYRSIVVVFTDLSADSASDLFDAVLQQLAMPSYAGDGLVLGGFFETNEGTALYNSSLRPFTAPVPFLLIRQTVISDWKFFLDKEDWLKFWARHHEESAVPALAEELRRLPWRTSRD